MLLHMTYYLFTYIIITIRHANTAADAAALLSAYDILQDEKTQHGPNRTELVQKCQIGQNGKKIYKVHCCYSHIITSTGIV